MIVAIHQPDFLPWLGFFNKIAKADVWVVLNHTKNNPRDAAFWCRRVRMVNSGVAYWVSLPLEKPAERGVIGVPINTMRYSYKDPTIYSKALRKIEINYAKTRFFKEVFPLVSTFFLDEERRMEKRNMAFIVSLMELLGITTSITFSSDLPCTESSTRLLIEIAESLNADTYLCGGGASGYQEDALFERHNITLKYNNFSCAGYPQHGCKEFIPGLSIVDPLMNVGIEGVRDLIGS